MTFFIFVFVILYFAGAFATSIYCACRTPKDDRVPWLMIIILVPFGWIGFWMFGPSAASQLPEVPNVFPGSVEPTEKEIAARVMADLQNLRTKKS